VNKRQTLTMDEAARRVRRSRRTIRRWLNEDGMRFHWRHGRKMIRLDDLLLHYRRHLLADPTKKRPEGARKKVAPES
jgi:excisionase family DNA binding protein